MADVLRPVVFVGDMLGEARKFELKTEEGILVSPPSRGLSLLYLLWRSRSYSHRLIDVQETIRPWPRGMLTVDALRECVRTVLRKHLRAPGDTTIFQDRKPNEK